MARIPWAVDVKWVTVKSMYLDMRGRYQPALVGREGVITGEKEEGSGGADTPEEKVVVKTG